MSDEEIVLIRGSGNLYADLGDPDAETKQIKAYLCAKIISVLNQRRLTVREAAKVTGVAAADISRVRNAELGRFTIDRLVRILSSLDRTVEIRVRTAKRSAA